jgi:hypothetical protein
MTLDSLREPSALLVVLFNSACWRAVEEFVVTRNTVGDLKIIILDDEGAPSEIKVRLTVMDSLTKLLTNATDDMKHFLLVSLELLVVLWMNCHLLSSNLLHLYNKLEHSNCKWYL